MKKKFGRTDKRDYNAVNIKTYAQILLFEKKEMQWVKEQDYNCKLA